MEIGVRWRIGNIHPDKAIRALDAAMQSEVTTHREDGGGERFDSLIFRRHFNSLLEGYEMAGEVRYALTRFGISAEMCVKMDGAGENFISLTQYIFKLEKQVTEQLN